MSEINFWIEKSGKLFCSRCFAPVKLYNPPYNDTLTLIVDGEEVVQTPEEWTNEGLEQLKTVCNECNIFLYDPADDEDED